MATAVIGALRANLSVNTAAFSKGLKDAEGGLQRFAKHAKVAAAAIAGALTAAVGGLAVALNRSIAEADKMGKMAQSIGIPVEELSRLKHAAELSGLSLEQLSTSVSRLSRNMNDVAQGAGAEARRAFDQLGISVQNTDGSLKSSTQVMTEVAERLSRMPDGAEKTALAMQLMGRSGAQMIPMLNQGADGMRRMLEEADQLGIVITGNTAVAAAAFRDNLDRLSKVKQGVINQLQAYLLPAMERLSQWLVEVAKNGSLVEKVSHGLISAFRFLAEEIFRLSIGMRQFTREAAAFLELWRAASIHGIVTGFRDVGRAWEQFQDASAESRREIEEFQKSLDRLFAPRTMTFDQFQRDLQIMRAGMQGAAGDAEQLGGALGRAGSAATAAGKPLDLLPPKLNEIGRAGQQVSFTLESAFSSLFDSAVDGTFRLRDAVGNLLKDLGRLLANQAFRTLFTGSGGLFGGSFPGFAQGGSFRVGGSGGIDSQLVAFRATPGEQVEIRKPGQDAGGGATANIVVNMDARGADRDGIMQAVARLERELPRRAVEAVREAQSRRALA